MATSEHPPGAEFRWAAMASLSQGGDPQRPAGDGGAAAALGGEPLRILIADDYPPNLQLLSIQLDALGMQADPAPNGLEALAKWRQSHYAAIITDCGMPLMDGYALARKIRAIELANSLPRTPIVAWTASSLSEEAANCLSSGMDAVLVKPSGIQSLSATLAKHLGAGRSLIPEPDAPHPALERPWDPDILSRLLPDPGARDAALLRFMGRLDSDLAEIFDIYAHGRIDELESLAHRARGACLMIGAAPLARAFANMESAAQAGAPESAGQAAGAILEARSQLGRQLARLGIASQTQWTPPC